MTILLQRLHDELVRRHYATTTRESYLKILKAFQRHVGKRLDHVGPNDLRRYQVYLLEDDGSPWARSSPSWPRSASSTCAC